MKRIFILGLLFLLMYALQFLQVEIEAPFHPKSLATLGFVLLAAYTFGQITSGLSLPRITGYIITGILFGPYVVNLFSVGVVNDLKVVNSLAIGLIALTAGGELKLSGLRSIAKSLTFIVLIKGFLILAVITLTVFAIKGLIPFLAGQGTPLILTVGAIFGIMAIGTSPAATIAVINETGSRGRLTDTTLGAAVVKDVVMVVMLAVAISLAKLFSTPGAVFDSAVFLRVGEELLFSLLAGAILGVLIILYIKFIHAEMWLFIVGLIFSATAVADLLHLEALLMFITAGFVVQNFSKFGDSLIHPIEGVSLPVYVVFFSIAGAGLDLRALQQVGLVAVILVVVRIAAIYWGTRVATALAKEPVAIKKNAWLSFIAQAGVVLGLSIIVENNLPGLGSEIKTVVLGTIALNLIIGPITFKLALSNAGETQEQREKTEREALPEAPTDAVAPQEATPQLPAQIDFPVASFPSQRLNEAANALRDDLIRLQKEFDETFTKPQTAEWQAFIAQLRDDFAGAVAQLTRAISARSGADTHELALILRESRIRFSRSLMGKTVAAASNEKRIAASQSAFEEMFKAVAGVCEATAGSIVVAQEPERFSPLPGDSLFVRARKMLKRWQRGLNRIFSSGAELERLIYFRRLCKFYFCGALPEETLPAANMINAQPLFALKKCRILYNLIDEGYEAIISALESNDENSLTAPACLEALGKMKIELQEEFKVAAADIGRYGKDCDRRLTLSWSQVFSGFLKALALAGTFELPRRQHRYSKIYERSKKAKAEIAQTAEIWDKYCRGFAGLHAKFAETVMLSDNVSRAVDETFLKISQSIFEKLATEAAAAQNACAQSRQDLERAFAARKTAEALQEEIIRQRDKIIVIIQSQALQHLNQLRGSRELNSLINIMLRKFSELADEMPKEYLIVNEDDIPSRSEEGLTPPDTRLQALPLQEITRAYLESEIARDLAEINQTVLEEVDEVIQAVNEVYKIVKYNLDAATEVLQAEPPETDQPEAMARPRELAVGSLQRAEAKLEAALTQAAELERQLYEKVSTQVDAKLEKIDQVILQQSTLIAKAQLRQKEAVALGYLYLERAWRWVVANYKILVRWLEHRYRPLAEEKIKDIRATLGLQKLTPAEILAIQDQAKLEQSAIASLPFIYQKLFDIAPLETIDFLIARDEEIEIVKTARQRWQQGMPSAVAVIGELGSGKTSFINVCVKEIFTDCRVFNKEFSRVVANENDLAKGLAELFGMKSVKTFRDLEAKIGKMADSTVIILEDAHKLCLRTLGGFDALKRLLLLVANTSHKVLWIFSMREYAWRYLERVIGISDYFTFVINTENISREEMERVILARHRVSGYNLHFLPSEVMKQRRKYRRASEEEKQEILQNEYFSQLRKLTEGNILSAIFYWLKSLGEAQDGNLEVKPPQKLNFDFLQDLTVDKLLTLAMVVQHGSLSVDEHVQIFGKDAPASEAVLTYLTNINLLIKEFDENGGVRFAMSRVIFKPLANELRALRILH